MEHDSATTKEQISLALTRVADSQKPCIKWKKSGAPKALHHQGFIYAQAQSERRLRAGQEAQDGYLLGRAGGTAG